MNLASTKKEGELSWFAKLKAGLSKTSNQISDGITSIFTKRKLDAGMVEELEELLILSDMGATTAAKIVTGFSKGRFDKELSPEDVKTALAAEITPLLAPYAQEMVLDTKAAPHVILVVGVNGNGKTTTMGKMAYRLREDGFSVMMAAADTFRAAATEQLVIWGQRSGVPVITAADGADAASVAFRAYEEAKAKGVDVLLIDTAGRLNNKDNLMKELEKIARVLKKLDANAPHTVLQILDGTTGQNALAQVEAFKSIVNVSGLVVTKLDGTAKGGIVVALAEKFKLPIYAIGVGEGIHDLREFSAEDFAKSLVGC